MITAFIVSMFIYCLLFSPVYFIARFLKKKKQPFYFWKECWYFSFFLYCVCIFSQTILPSREVLSGNEVSFGGSNFTPLETIRFYINKLGGSMHTVALYNLLGNILLFVPFGFYVPSIFRQFQATWKMCVVAVAIPVFIETTQYFIGRSIDVDDVILNTLAILIGYSIFYVFRRMFKYRIYKAEKS